MTISSSIENASSPEFISISFSVVSSSAPSSSASVKVASVGELVSSTDILIFNSELKPFSI